MNCIRCSITIDKNIYNSKKYCSPKCCKLYLKIGYRQRHREEIYAYKNNWRRAKNGGNRPIKHPAAFREESCLNCSGTEDLQVAHIKPIGLGGTHRYVITLCRKHHYQFDTLLKDFWLGGFEYKSKNIQQIKIHEQKVKYRKNPVTKKPSNKYKLPEGVISVIPSKQ